MVFISKIFHKWLNPHCIECAEERKCPNCNEMRELLAQERIENTKLLGIIRDLAIPVKEEEPAKEIPKDLKAIPRKTWRDNVAILEANDRANAQSLAEANKPGSTTPIKVDNIDIKVKTIDELESELGVLYVGK